ncbi:MAG: hypothetical protein PVF15_03795 [Candidatus Bathyarchaeota archaeon]|jgi:hypothetical protein
MKSVVLEEAIIFAPGERILMEDHVKYEGGLTSLAKKIKGHLTITDKRFMLVADTGQLAKKEKTVINTILPCLLSCDINPRFLGETLIVSFEDWTGFLQRPRFKVSDASSWTNAIESLLSTRKEVESVSEMKKKIEDFKQFVAFLSLEKFIRPLYFDPVSRVLKVGDQQAFIGFDWTVQSPPDLQKNLERWLGEFLARR